MSWFERAKGKETPATVVDLRERIEKRNGPRWGLPSSCPECGAAGYLDHINLRERVMKQHCPTCSHTWVTAEADCVDA